MSNDKIVELLRDMARSKTRREEGEDWKDRIEWKAADAIAALEAEVRRLREARQSYLDAVDLYNERVKIMRSKPLGSMNVYAEFKAIDTARREFDRVAIEIADQARAALVDQKCDVCGAATIDKPASGFIARCGKRVLSVGVCRGPTDQESGAE